MHPIIVTSSKKIRGYVEIDKGNTLKECLFLSVIDEVSRSEILTENKVKEAENKLAEIQKVLCLLLLMFKL